MRIGILETATLAPEVKNEYGSYAEMFQRLFLSVDDQVAFNVYPVINGQYPGSNDECDAFLITGSKFDAHGEEPWIIKLRDYIVDLHEQRKKLIGICFGHQLIARALGGLSQRSKNGWGVGNVSSEINQVKPWMGDENDPSFKKQFSLLVSHQDQVVKLPDQATLISSSKHCPISGFQVASHILTFQGHPEFTADYLRYTMNKRRDLIGEEKYNKAIDSLKRPDDSLLVTRWMLNFIKIG